MLAVKWLLLFGESKMKIEFWHGFSYVGCAEMLYWRPADFCPTKTF